MGLFYKPNKLAELKDAAERLKHHADELARVAAIAESQAPSGHISEWVTTALAKDANHVRDILEDIDTIEFVLKRAR